MKKGFSLVELMIVVAIIGILAAIAIPNYLSFQLKGKRSELPGNVNGIKTAEMGYEAAFDTYVNCSATPSPQPTKTPQPFTATSTGFDTIGWQPDGTVRGQYKVVMSGNEFTATGTSNIDNAGGVATYQATVSTNAAQMTGNDTY